MLTKKQKLIRATSWLYQRANPNHKVKWALNVLNQPSDPSVKAIYTDFKRTIAKRILWDSKTNLVKEYRDENKYRYSKTNELLNYLKLHAQIAPKVSIYLYSGLVTFKNCKISRDEYGNPIIVTPKNHSAYKLLKAIEKRIKSYLNGDYASRGKGQRLAKRNMFMLVNAIENSFFNGIRNQQKDIQNVHEHILFGSFNKLPIATGNYNELSNLKDLTEYINNYFDDDINISVKPLINKIEKHAVVIDDTTTASDWGTVKYSSLYDLKQNKLPLPKNYKDYRAFKYYNHQTEAVEAILNSIPSGMNLHGVLNFKNRKRKLMQFVLDSIKSDQKRLYELISARLKLSKNNLPRAVKNWHMNPFLVVNFKHFDDLPPPFNYT